MDEMIVRPGGPLSGEIPISGAKNSVLKLMVATVLAPGRFVIRNVPRISDVDWMAETLVALGLDVDWSEPQTLVIDSTGTITPEAPYRLVEQMRASTALLGALLARCGEARIAMPGGDDFGDRPIDLHLQGLQELGADIELSHGNIVATTSGLTGARVVLEYPSVGATENLLLAATRATGITVIENAAREPEIVDLAAFVNRMGARVVGAGSSTITITGVDELHSVEHEVIPDRVEAATYLTILGAARGEVLLRGARANDLQLLIGKLGEMGMRISPDAAGIWAMASSRPTSVDLATLPYPGIATDYLPMLIALLPMERRLPFTIFISPLQRRKRPFFPSQELKLLWDLAIRPTDIWRSCRKMSAPPWRRISPNAAAVPAESCSLTSRHQRCGNGGGGPPGERRYRNWIGNDSRSQ